MEREPDDVTTTGDRAPVELACEDLRLRTTRLRKHLEDGDQLVRQLHTGSPTTDAVLRELLAELSERTAEVVDAADEATSMPVRPDAVDDHAESVVQPQHRTGLGRNGRA